MSELLQHESFAREIAAGVAGRYSLAGFPAELVPVVDEMLAEAAHDALEAAEGYAALEDAGIPEAGYDDDDMDIFDDEGAN